MNTNDLQTILKNFRLKVTSARVSILTACVSASSPQTVSEVAKIVGDRIHLATIYRTLESFVALGILTRIDFQEGYFRYEYIHDHHHHIVCESCGKISEIQDQSLESLTNKLSERAGFTLLKHNIELFGHCHKCQKKGLHDI